MERPHPDPQKQQQTEQHLKQLEEFKAKGGEIFYAPYGHSADTKKKAADD